MNKKVALTIFRILVCALLVTFGISLNKDDVTFFRMVVGYTAIFFSHELWCFLKRKAERS